MALVAYASSGEDSDSEIDKAKETKENFSLFGSLPRPQINHGGDLVEENDEFLLKKETPVLLSPIRKKIVITVPSLSEFKEEKEDKKIKLKSDDTLETRNSKLFQILPPPKHSASEESVLKLIPKCLNRKLGGGKSQVEIAREKARQKRLQLLKPNVKYNSDSEDDEADCTDFFALEKKEEPLIGTELMHNFVPPTNDVKDEAVTDDKINMNPEDYIAEDHIIDSEVIKPIDEAPPSDVIQLTKEDILKLDKATKRKADDIEFIDVNESDLLLTPEDRIKALSVEQSHVNYTKNCAPLAKKKHQITYLAELAKEREVELKDMWAQNKLSRRQTQAKYGF